MKLRSTDCRWLRRGCQKRAVAQVLRKPMTSSEIWRAARLFAPRLQLRDVWFLLGEMRERGLVACLNPGAATGKVHVLTERGRQVVAQIFGSLPEAPAERVNWKRYGWVARARIRRLVLLELSRPWAVETCTAAAIRRGLRERHPVGLNPVLRALKDLHGAGLIHASVRDDHDLHKRYVLTPKGRRIAEQILT